MEFPETFPRDFKAERYGLPYLTAIRFFCEPDVHEICATAWCNASESRGSIVAHADRGWGQAERDTLERLRSLKLWGYGRPDTAARPFRRIEPHEWDGFPRREADGALRIGGTCFRQVHVHNIAAIPYKIAVLAFGDAAAAEERMRKFWRTHVFPSQPDSLDAQLFASLAEGRLAGQGCPLTPFPRSRTVLRSGLSIGWAGGPVRPEGLGQWVNEQYFELLHGSPEIMPADWWRLDRFRCQEEQIEADGRLFGDLRVKLLTPALSPIQPDTNSIDLTMIVTQPDRAAPKMLRGGKSYDREDSALINEMERLLAAGEADNPWSAAQSLAARAAGGGTSDAKAKRLLGKFQKRSGLNASERT